MSEQQKIDTGFSAKYEASSQRLLKRNGRFNVKRTGITLKEGFNLYDELMVASRLNFFLFILGSYFAINIIFTMMYCIIGFDGINGLEGETHWDQALEVFFFSTQTFATVGYGTMSPNNFAINLVATFEAFIGLLSFAIATGLLYGRFARPKAKYKFSDKAIIAPYKDGRALMFRFANLRKSELTEVSVEVIIAYTQDGQRKFTVPKLEIGKINFLTTSWTIVLKTDEEKSPLIGLDKQMLQEMKPEIMILVKGFDDNFAQTISHRMSYYYDEIEIGKKFKRIMFADENGLTTVSIDALNEMEDVTL